MLYVRFWSVLYLTSVHFLYVLAVAAAPKGDKGSAYVLLQITYTSLIFFLGGGSGKFLARLQIVSQVLYGVV